MSREFANDAVQAQAYRERRASKPCYYDRDPLKNPTCLRSNPGCSRAVCARSRFVLLLSVMMQTVQLRNAWWSLEWSPREKEPPAVGIGGGKLPSCTSTFVPPVPAPARFGTLDPATRAQCSLTPFCPPIPLAWSPHLFNRCRRRQGWLVLH